VTHPERPETAGYAAARTRLLHEAGERAAAVRAGRAAADGEGEAVAAQVAGGDERRPRRVRRLAGQVPRHVPVASRHTPRLSYDRAARGARGC